ncbi:hypothetical protein M422DRAFT_243323 [Sphaerobolus stellatus SS14]|nr:hypothetical protein M422DRAFT_243323 [Sphaerobolus stellatus SS14]
MTLIIERFVIPMDSSNGSLPLRVAVKRYTSSSSAPSPNGVSLLLTHGVTFHKELWEPVITRLFDLHSQYGSPLHIREAWAIDSPNHGESAALNDHILGPTLITFREYARAIVSFLESGLIDLRYHRLIGLSHSAGSAPLIWAADQWYRTYNYFPFRSLLLLEPPLISATLDKKYKNFNSFLAAKALKRRETWASQEEAMAWFQKQQRSWDPQCIQLFSQYGLRQTSAGVSLNCRGAQEAACYSVIEQNEVLNILSHICPRIPIHTIFSEFVDLSPNPEIRQNIVDARAGRKMASVTWMPGVGHFAPLENPDVSAHAVFHCLYLSINSREKPSNSQMVFVESRL